METRNRGAARIATLVAVPAALLTGILIFGLLGGFGRAAGGTAPRPEATTPRPEVTTPVSMPQRQLSERATTVCRDLLTRLPEKLRDRSRRPVTAGPAQNTAYGDPAITLSCGTTVPSYRQDDQLLVISGTCWYPQDQPEQSIWTTVDREIPVTITVPKAYEGAAQWVAGLAPSLLATVPTVPDIPYGCGG
jgi:hypothetical protein